MPVIQPFPKPCLSPYQLVGTLEQEAFTSMEKCKWPVVAAVHGEIWAGTHSSLPSPACFLYEQLHEFILEFIGVQGTLSAVKAADCPKPTLSCAVFSIALKQGHA